MFSESLANGSEQAQNALQRLTAFLEAEGDHGRISPALQKKILGKYPLQESDTCIRYEPFLFEKMGI